MKLFISEKGTSEMYHYMSGLEREILFTATLSGLEIRSAIRRRQTARELSDSQVILALSALESVSQVLRMVGRDASILRHAAEVVDRTAMKALDAIQLGTALWMRQQLTGADELVFVASDRRLLRAAEGEGLVTWDPSA